MGRRQQMKMLVDEVTIFYLNIATQPTEQSVKYQIDIQKGKIEVELVQGFMSKTLQCLNR